MYKDKFIQAVRDLNIVSDYVVIKPNWVEDIEGAYVEAEILDWLFEALPNQKKIVIESYTKWRGGEEDGIATDIVGGKKFWEHYKQKDAKFLAEKGIDNVLAKHKIEYINITNEVWSERCAKSDLIKKIVEKKYSVYWPELYSYIPQKLFDIRKRATLISLAKIKKQAQNSYVYASLSTKNLFGLIPQPNRKNPYHGHNTSLLPKSIADINHIYTSLFNDSVFINEGLNIWGDDCWSDSPKVVRNAGLLFIGRDSVKTDSETCKAIGIDPAIVPYLKEI